MYLARTLAKQVGFAVYLSIYLYIYLYSCNSTKLSIYIDPCAGSSFNTRDIFIA